MTDQEQGFLPPDEFEAVADRFFARPFVSIRGWERAIDAQSRIVREVEHVLARGQEGDVLFVGNGAVGTLLLCHYSGVSIDRTYDQPAGGVTVSRSPKKSGDCCISGVGWKTCRVSNRAMVPDLTGCVGINLNARVSLPRWTAILSWLQSRGIG